MKYNVLVLIHGHHSVAPGSLSNADVKWFLYLEGGSAGVEWETEEGELLFA